MDQLPPSINLTDEDIEEFRTIYKAEFNEEISFEEARVKATQFMTLFALIARKPPEKPKLPSS